MTEQELIARLRVDEPACEEHFTANLAADCIEELIKERDELGRRLNTALYGQPHFAWSIHEEAMADLRAKLTKAVEALRECQEALRDHIKQYPHMAKGYTVDAEKNARAMLAELENEQ